jgi:sulfate adenylyltransferase subunit 2
MELLVHRNPEAQARGINPFDHGSALHTQMWKTDGLKQALEKYGFDAAIGGARRDEERVRAKERVFSFRAAGQRWDPKRQRPELWRLYNTRKARGESFRVFPISNWTELDVWQYVEEEGIEVSELYFSAPRRTLEREGTLLMLDDERLVPRPGEEVRERCVRFRTLGCYPLSGAVESRAASVPELIEEMLAGRQSERQGRLIDRDGTASMERKKREGYF